MSYTNYGLAEGLTMLILPIVIITALYLLTMNSLPKSYKKRNTLLLALIFIMMALDTAWWAFDIQTGIIDFLVTGESGTEQVTLCSFIMTGLVMYMIISRPPGTTDTKNDEN